MLHIFFNKKGVGSLTVGPLASEVIHAGKYSTFGLVFACSDAIGVLGLRPTASGV
jgi:hypothetical protein